jgi:tRNA A-37 threonylcarbamoyl transferase component Bud32
VGKSVGNYRLTRLLGKGAFGAVYEGAHPVIGSRVAVKVLHPHISRDPTIAERFVNEARAVNLIGHDGLVHVFDFDRLEDGRQYFTMEFIEGRPLAALAARAPLPLREVGPILLEICDALGEAHERGIVHRDLKPDNVFLATRGGEERVKVMDFGLAKLRLKDERLTQSGVTLGTPYYMSPEQALGQSADCDGRADIYTLGVIMFVLATGRLPFLATTPLEILLAHARIAPPRPREVNPAVSASYEAVILRCLEKRPEDRFQTMRELGESISACMKEAVLPAEAPPVARAEPVRHEAHTSGPEVQAHEPTVRVDIAQLGGAEVVTDRARVPQVPNSPVAGGAAAAGPVLDAPTEKRRALQVPVGNAGASRAGPAAPTAKRKVLLWRPSSPAAASPQPVVTQMLAVGERAEPSERARRKTPRWGAVAALAAALLAAAALGAVGFYFAVPRAAPTALPPEATPVEPPRPTAVPAPPEPAAIRLVAIEIATAPPGAAVAATWGSGSGSLERTPGAIDVPEGAEVALVVTLAGHASAREIVRANGPRKVRLALEPVHPPPKPARPKPSPRPKEKSELKDVDF